MIKVKLTHQRRNLQHGYSTLCNSEMIELPLEEEQNGSMDFLLRLLMLDGVRRDPSQLQTRISDLYISKHMNSPSVTP